jgi:hypothetical protein
MYLLHSRLLDWPPNTALLPKLSSASSPSRDCVAVRKSHECHSEPQAKNVAFPATYEGEILRLSPQDDIATQSVTGEDRGEGAILAPAELGVLHSIN